MKAKKRSILWSSILVVSFLVAMLLFPQGASASPGLVTHDLNSGLTPTDLANALLGGGVTISNVTFHGVNVAAGTFSGGTGIIGFEGGIILSTGNIASVVGPNKFDGTTTSNGQPGDADLGSLVPGYATFDAAVLEFDFIPTSSVVIFDYVFGSEEYNEYVNSIYNNVFGFFINGSNVALIPGTSIPVAINNVNGGNPFGTNASHPEFYRNNSRNDPGPATIDTELDGLTVVFTATANVNPGVINHIKLGIADAGDSLLDSDVFIKAGSFTSPNLILEPLTSTNPTGTSHTCTATATVNGVPQANVLVNFEVTSGPKAGLTGTGLTNSSGQATFTYTSNSPGMDTIVATATVGGSLSTSNNAFKTWTGPIIQTPATSNMGMLIMVVGIAALMIVLVLRRSRRVS